MATKLKIKTFEEKIQHYKQFYLSKFGRLPDQVIIWNPGYIIQFLCSGLKDFWIGVETLAKEEKEMKV